MTTPLNPPPPYCSARLFQSTGRLSSKRIGGVFGLIDSMRPRTSQNAGLAGDTRLAGVGAFSATVIGYGFCSTLESISRAPNPECRRAAHAVAGSAPSEVVAAFAARAWGC